VGDDLQSAPARRATESVEKSGCGGGSYDRAADLEATGFGQLARSLAEHRERGSGQVYRDGTPRALAAMVCVGG
jgi:hypothetical protein